MLDYPECRRIPGQEPWDKPVEPHQNRHAQLEHSTEGECGHPGGTADNHEHREGDFSGDYHPAEDKGEKRYAVKQRRGRRTPVGCRAHNGGERLPGAPPRSGELRDSRCGIAQAQLGGDKTERAFREQRVLLTGECDRQGNGHDDAHVIGTVPATRQKLVPEDHGDSDD